MKMEWVGSQEGNMGSLGEDLTSAMIVRTL